jgi:triacylglycerol lipase
MSLAVPTGSSGREEQHGAPESGDHSVRFEEVVAAGERLWIRGRLSRASARQQSQPETKSWWGLRRATNGARAAQPACRLETRIGGVLIEAIPILDDAERFEARLTAPLPPARRGWRVARHCLFVGAQRLEACNLVVQPPAGARRAVIVILPLAFTEATAGLEMIARTRLTGLTERVRALQTEAGSYAIYYLACISGRRASGPTEVALAATALGWPAGHFVILDTDGIGADAAIRAGVERMRWVFAGSLDLIILNLEPGIGPLPVEPREPADDWAVVRRLVHADLAAATPSITPARSRANSINRSSRSALVPRHPLVFCHGMLALSMLRLRMPADLNCFSSLREFLRDRGVQAFFPEVPPTSGVQERAQCLCDQIRCWTDEPVNLVAHSMGGLDARWAISRLGMADQVQSLTTISTPHHGTYLADWFRQNFRHRVPLLLALEAVGINVDGFRDCGLEACQRFAEQTPNSPKVRYFSFGGEVGPAHLSPVLRRAWSILMPIEGPNDGMVSAASARWGEYLGTIHADHYAQTPDAVFVRPGEDYDSLGFYYRLIEDLARRGF